MYKRLTPFRWANPGQLVLIVIDKLTINMTPIMPLFITPIRKGDQIVGRFVCSFLPWDQTGKKVANVIAMVA
ncbi:MAG: hypothetical protein D8B54_01700 [Catonella sp.]|nr:MAG: hypothetical protein D8B54_01700 [Catonella sp.]